jgi:DNA-nicking Smr family endonuclease
MRRSRDQELALWQAAMRDVKPLKRTKPAAVVPAARPAPAKTKKPAAMPRLVMGPAPMAPVTIARDGPPEISHGRATGIDRRSSERLRRGHLPIEGKLDLHGMTQAAAVDRLAGFIERAEAAGKRCVLVITGKGLATGGVLRDQVPRWLNLPPNRARVLAFDYARPQHGGSGALYVLLKRRRTT